VKILPDYDAHRGDGLPALAPIDTCMSGDSRISDANEGIRLSVLSGDRNLYSNAQLDDYRTLPRRAFPNRPPLSLSVRARFSHEPAASLEGPGLLGTAGFGFWNDPFAMTSLRIPMLPRAVWFFYASRPSNMKLDLDTPGCGWKAGTLDALRPEAIPPALAAPLLIPLMRSRALYRRAWPRVQHHLRIKEASVGGSMTGWRDYRIDWGSMRARFFVDGELLLDAPAPRGPLGFVIWCDNQYMIATPQGRIGHGYLPTGPQWLEFSRLTIASM
jgi:hypothetical protein